MIAKIQNIFWPVFNRMWLASSLRGPKGFYVCMVLDAIGAAIAASISWSNNQSIGLAIVHGILGWFYILYQVISSAF